MKSTNQILGSELEAELLKQLEQIDTKTIVSNVGSILSVGDGVATISGLSGVMMNEIITLPGGTTGLALSLLNESVSVVLLGEYTHLKQGDRATATGTVLSVPVGPAFQGRVVNALNQPIDGKSAPKSETMLPVERIAQGVITRQHVSQPVQTGIIAIDAMIPVGRGQRELIIGDRGTGKSSIAITTIMNQKDQNLKCIYVTIGQKRSFVAKLEATLEKYGAMEYTTIVAATASDPASMQFLAPYSATCLGEYYAEHGQDALIIYDDLSKHAWAYREISLLLRRPSGREAYPGDVFYLHSRLLERSCRLNKKYGGGSLTALPIIETQAGDVSAYIPTNVISITDGQIYLETDLFNSGFKPAINSGLSVSRVGGDAQVKAMKKVAGRLRLDLAQYHELAAFSQFASDLDAITKAQLDKGARVSEILKQGWDEPMSVEKQVILIWAVTEGYAKNIELKHMGAWKKNLLEYLETKPGLKLCELLKKEATLSDEVLKQMKSVTEVVLSISEGLTIKLES
ncbi:F0F1 ATP synthase subunit alpha [Candidatus Collierbacteria bacterium CG10_big_fil_rev_8_21_14_0_10_44_9]|uniref:ATP synthase subunit alpha n=1 Tax=Candidatus Collierbacteria bacterium CG10_big_fil_rev_8_21_14_0_10_44_9 TaxID=1974535 RepID=A0A2H0VJG2_9BACT|nr:MAG: F0F1 ATP synthase subunit alpha [Candidatus Collierbacteria bacterium CG10_big_fil_rev_8_21_14_0_10_44_9]